MAVGRFGLILDAFWIDFGSILGSLCMHFGVRGAFGTPGQRRWAWSQKRARGIEFFFVDLGPPLGPFGAHWVALGVPSGAFGRPLASILGSWCSILASRGRFCHELFLRGFMMILDVLGSLWRVWVAKEDEGQVR